MDKIKLSRVFGAYIDGLRMYDRLRFSDMALQFGFPIIIGVLLGFGFVFIPGDVSDIKAVIGNAISAVSIISGLMCALAVLIFQLRVQLSTGESVKVSDREYMLVDHLFNDALWDVVVGLSCALTLVVASGLVSTASIFSAVLLATSTALSVHFLLVTTMCIKRLSIAYEVIAKAWSKRR